MGLLEDYENVLTQKPLKGQKEQNVQNFLEQHSELLPTPILLNHQLHLNAIISKYPFGPFITDYVYITKSSNEWKIVFTELEDPDKLYFSDSNPTSTAFTNDFNKAIKQVKDWQIYIDEHKDEIIEKLNTLLQPVYMQANPKNFAYVLIYGRSKNRDSSDERKKYIDRCKKDNGIEIYSYDTLIHIYESQRFHEKKLILSPKQTIFSIKILDEMPKIFSFVSSSNLIVKEDFIQQLKAKNYDMDAWKKGKLLSVDNKYTNIERIIEKEE